MAFPWYCSMATNAWGLDSGKKCTGGRAFFLPLTRHILLCEQATDGTLVKTSILRYLQYRSFEIELCNCPG